MPDPDKVNAVVAEWVEKAEHDYRAAVHILKLGRKAPTDIVCFHAQQCVEKYLKAILVLKQIPFPKTHDIAQLASMLPAGHGLSLTADEQDQLTEYATEMRYPYARDVPPAEARRAVALCRRVRRAARKLLPPETLRRKVP
ncbi:MAG: HEPN domain-containing protein, partial [Burkholderiaceae bacterium]|nr:HEPN domain-containing protein [Burkholderiaceae bacterium]